MKNASSSLEIINFKQDKYNKGDFKMKIKKIFQIILIQVFLITSINMLASCTKKNKELESILEYTIAFQVDGATYFQVKVDSNNSIVFPLTPTKTNYTFGGWYLDNNVWQQKLTADYPVNKDTIAYAKWDLALETLQYTITYDYQYQGDHSKLTDIITYNNSYTLVVPNRNGYNFIGWYDESNTKYTNSSGESLFNWSDTNDKTLYAKWEAINYTIAFENNGGSEIESITQGYGTEVLAPSIPSKLGYTFVGWYSDIELIEAYAFTTMPLEGLTLYAKWEINPYTIAFESNGGSFVESITQSYDSEVLAPTPPSRIGYTFVGWYSDMELTEAYAFTTMPLEGLTLYAKWEAINYTIVFEVNGGSEIEDITQGYETEVLAPSIPSKLGYTFIGWYSDIELTEAYAFTTMPLEGLTLYAKWEAINYTISFESNGGSFVESIIKGYNTEVLPPVSPTKVGYIFRGWYSDEGLTNKYTFTTMPLEGLTLYAKWEAIIYTIIFESNGGNSIANITQGYETSVSAPTPPTKIGHTFLGWCIDEELTEAYVFTTMPLNGLKLYANWQLNNYTITFESNGGSFVESIIQGYNTNVLDPIDPTKVGHTFLGWYSNEGLTNKYTFTTMPLNGLKLYANWQLNNYTITFESNGGSFIESITQGYNTTVIAPVNPIKDECTFKGWYSDEELTKKYVFSVMPLDGLTLYAKWEVGTSGLQYTLIDGGYSVSLGHAKNIHEIIIPSVYNGKPVIALGLYAFDRCINLVNITIPASVINIETSAFRDCINLANINVDEDNEYYYSINGVLFNKEVTNLIKYPAGKLNNSYSITEGVVYINASAFENCKNLISIIIPDGVISIGEWAFYNCNSLINIVIPSSVTSIGQGAFLYCNSLESITIPFVGASLDATDNTHFGYIFGAYDFYNNIKYIPNSLKEVIIMGDNIDDNAFYGCEYLVNVESSEVNA